MSIREKMERRKESLLRRLISTSDQIRRSRLREQISLLSDWHIAVAESKGKVPIVGGWKRQ